MFVLVNSVNPDKMSHNGAFHLGHHNCQSTNLKVTSIQRVKIQHLFFTGEIYIFLMTSVFSNEFLNPFMPNVFSHLYQLDESISYSRAVGW